MQAQWIWPVKEAKNDEYAEFYWTVDATGGVADFRILCDGLFELYIDGEIAAWGKYPDYPHYRIMDERVVALKKGENHVALRVWHIGKDSFTYRKGTAGVAAELTQGGKVLFATGAETQGRISPIYANYREQDVTLQLGLKYRYDATKEDGWRMGTGKGFAPCVVVNLPMDCKPRPIQPLKTLAPVRGTIVQQGVFEEKTGDMVGHRMMQAGLYHIDPDVAFGKGNRNNYALGQGVTMQADVKAGKDKGVYLTIDLGKEDVGFLTVDFTVNEDCEVEIGYGEHLADGRPRTAIDARDFGHEYRAKKGDNAFTNYMRRLGGRYLTVFFHTDCVTVRTVGILPVYYPVKKKERKFRHPLTQKIWDVSVRTLELCMHDHYEDTPWREQSLYAMDSRNQMLFGYIAFGEKAFARASIKMLAEGRREDGLLALCAPAGLDKPIPYFSLMHVIETAEYCKESDDFALAEEIWKDLVGVMTAHANRLGEKGLLKNFQPDPPYWNFYEWTDGLDCWDDARSSYDAPLNAFYLIALKKFYWLAKKLGKTAEIQKLADVGNTIRANMKAFYDEKTGLYRTYIGKDENHMAELTNALIACAEVPDKKTKMRIAKTLANPNNELVKISMSHSIFKYDAMLMTSKRKFAPVILKEIEDRYSKMLYQGATSFWETDLGEADFDRAGSLSHAWSSIPVYIYDRLGVK